jgi:phage virion morphogenesis protein
MADRFSGTIDDAVIRREFERLRLKTRSRGLQRPLIAIGRYGKSSTQLRFRTETAPDGKRWAPSKRVQEEGGQTLRMTSRLRNSIQWEVDPAGVSWGTNVAYAGVHQNGYQGSQRVRGHQRLVRQVFGKRLRAAVRANVRPFSRMMRIEARPFLGLNDQDRQAILDILAADLERRG